MADNGFVLLSFNFANASTHNCYSVIVQGSLINTDYDTNIGYCLLLDILLELSTGLSLIN